MAVRRRKTTKSQTSQAMAFHNRMIAARQIELHMRDPLPKIFRIKKH